MSLVVAAAALNQTPFDFRGNTDRIRRAIGKARAAQARFLCLPELCICGYGCEDMFFSTWIGEKSWQCLCALLPDTQGLAVSIGLPLRHHEQLYNVLAFVDNGHILGFYAKQHLANTGVHYEARWFSPWPPATVATCVRQGQSYPIGEHLFTIDGCTVGLEICEDAWQTEGPRTRYSTQGVDLIMSGHASPYTLHKAPMREELVKAGAAACGVYLYANILGNEAGHLVFDGDALIAKEGHLLASAPRFSFEEVTLASADLAPKEKGTERSVLRHTFADTKEEFTHAAALTLWDYMRKSHTKGFVLSSSGGADSAMCAVLVAEMIRKVREALGLSAFLDMLFLDDKSSHEVRQRVESLSDPAAQVRALCGILLTMVYQSTENSSTQSAVAAKTLAEAIGAQWVSWSVQAEAQCYAQKVEKVLGRSLTWAQDDVALQNVQARARVPALWLLANAANKVLLATANRSESSVGYVTVDGDMAGGLAPLASLSKVFVLEWLSWAEERLGYTALAATRALPPSAELRPPHRQQEDEKDLMPYACLEAIEREAILHKKMPQQVLRALLGLNLASPEKLRQYVQRFFIMWQGSQWKRVRMPVSFHFDDLSVDPRSWYRFPVLSAPLGEEEAMRF